MTEVRNIAQLCFSSNLAGIVANKIEQSFYSVYSYSGKESIEHALSLCIKVICPILYSPIQLVFIYYMYVARIVNVCKHKAYQ